MLYVSAYDGASGRYSVTDTDDNSVDYASSGELFRIAQRFRIKILGVDLTQMRIQVVDRTGKPVKAKTRAEFFDENVGYDYIMEVREGSDFTEYVISIGGDVERYRVYGSDGNFKIYSK